MIRGRPKIEPKRIPVVIGYICMTKHRAKGHLDIGLFGQDGAGMSVSPDEDDAAAATGQVSFVVTNPRRITSKSIFALVDVEMQIAGISFLVLGVQARRLSSGGATVNLPTFRDTDGIWRPAIGMPGELRKPLYDAVLDFLVEEGLARRREIVPIQI